MVSVTPYHLPAIILMLLGGSALVMGGGGMYRAVPDGPAYHYSVSEPDEPLSDSDAEVIQFTYLSETGQEVFLEALDEGEYNTNKEATEIDIGSDYTASHYVEYQDQTYVFHAATNHSGWWMLGVIILGFVATIGLITLLVGGWFVKNHHFKLPTAILSGFLASILLREIILLTTEPPRSADNPLLAILVIPTVGILIWYLLTRVERQWETSFSQRMAQ